MPERDEGEDGEEVEDGAGFGEEGCEGAVVTARVAAGISASAASTAAPTKRDV